jgi:uncharacterized protein YigE (DUF2233 family)
MSRILLALMFVLGITTLVYAAPKWTPMIITSDTTVKSGPGQIVDANFYWSAVTSGDKMTIKNSVTIGTDTAVVFTIIPDTTTGSRQMNALQKDLVVDQGIYVDLTKTTGTFGVELFYQ